MGESAVRTLQSIVEQGAQDTCEHDMADETSNDAKVHGRSCAHSIENSIHEKVIIRRLRDSDSIHEITSLLHRAYKELADSGLHYGASTQDAERTLQRIEKGECWIAELDGRVVGTIVFMDPRRTSGCRWCRRSDVASFSQFGIEPDCQRLGIGSLLLDTIERRALETGARELSCNTASRAKHLINMYKRRGYRVVEYVSWSGTNFPSLIMSKCLEGDVGEERLWSWILRKIKFYGSFAMCKCLRTKDGKIRLWARAVRNLRFRIRR